MAENKEITGYPEPSTQSVVELLTSILNEVQKQVQSKTPPRPTGMTQLALDQFREIEAALALQPQPTIKLTADPTHIDFPGPVTLTWTSTAAQTVSIDNGIGEVTPPEAGSKVVNVVTTTKFTATAKGPCGSASSTVDVIVGGIIV